MRRWPENGKTGKRETGDGKRIESVNPRDTSLHEMSLPRVCRLPSPVARLPVLAAPRPYVSSYLHSPPGPSRLRVLMASRQKLLAAAARIYGESGFRGATTRRIADEAGVNEVTLFRLFGSKSALIAEAIREHAPRGTAPHGLPDEPVDAERELSAWCDTQLTHLRAARSMIRKAMGEIEEHPEMAPCMSEGTQNAFRELLGYVARLPR